MTQYLTQYYNFSDLITYSAFTNVSKRAKTLQLPLKSEDSVFGDISPFQIEQMLRNYTCKTQEYTSLCRQQKSCSAGEYLSGLSIFQYVVNLPCAWERSWQYTVSA